MKKTLSKAAGAVSGMTILSRIFGFIRDAFIAMTYGSSTAADAFFVAFRIPNMQRRVLGDGAVSSAFIPVFAEVLARNGKQAAQELTANILNILMIKTFDLGLKKIADAFEKRANDLFNRA